MTDPIERELKNLLDDRARGDPLAADMLVAGLATLPPRRRAWLGLVAPLGATLVIISVLAALAGTRLGGIAGESTPTPPSLATLIASSVPSHGPTLPGGPEAFASDPRLASCSFGPMEFVFVMDHARDYRRYLPHMGLSPELDVDASALVVVFRQNMPQPPTTGFGPGATNEPGHRYVCVVTDGGSPNLYADVDITGLSADVSSGAPSPLPTTVSSSIDASAAADVAAALDVATSYETARAGGDWNAAWALLSDQAQALIGTPATFASNERAYNATGGTTFTIQAPIRASEADPELVANYLGASLTEIATEADVSRGALVFITHPHVQAASAGLFVAPIASGEWRIWLIH